MWGLKIELACRRVERGAGGDAAPLPAPCLVLLPGQDLAAGETPARCPAWQQCPGAVPWVTPSQQSCPGSPQPVQPCWLMLKPAAATGPGLPRLRDLMDVSPVPHSSGTGCKRGEEGVSGVTVHPGMSMQSLSAGKWGDPTGFWVQEKPQQKAAGGVPEQGGQGTQGPFMAVSPVVTLTSHPLLPRSPLLSCCLCARAQSPPGHCHQCRPSAQEPCPLSPGQLCGLCAPSQQLLQKCLCWSLFAR